MKARFEKITAPGEQSFLVSKYSLPSFVSPWHFHPEFELTLILESSGRRFVGDHVGNFGPGDLVLLGSNLPHCWFNSRGDGHRRAVSVVIQFKEGFVGDHFWRMPEARSVAKMLSRSARGIQFGGKTARKISDRMEGLMELKGFPRVLECLGILHGLSLSREVQELSSPGFAPAKNEADERRIARVLDYVNRNVSSRIEQPVAARIANLAPAAFSRFFRRRTGKAFSGFVNEVRIGHACKLLVEQGLTSIEICFACGFENLSNFNRRFRELKGMPPQEYRRMFAATADTTGC